ncbi:MAG: hypothetical protein JST67_05755 [Bacteroidetes bacterium]|nr:hypothetical protein [Bacteroidota bacterium]
MSTYNVRITPDITNGNITGRSDLLRGLTETFGYDGINRLTTNTINANVTTLAYQTTGTGNIAKKTSTSPNGSNLGNYAYQNNAFNQLNTVENVDASISSNTQSAAYNSFSKLTNLTEGDYTYDISYGPDMQRVQSILTNTNTGTQLKRDYVPNYEKTTGANQYSRELSYIQAPSGLCAIYAKNGSDDTLYFVYTDHLGSILKLTDANGTVRAEQSFDPWGRYRNPNDWTYTNVLPPTGIIYRGFTGHEHLQNFDLINMNGRVYDSKLGLFLSIDPLMDKTPGISPYHYALNNPLKFTDPSGTTGQSTFVDEFGNVIGGKIDGDKGVYQVKGVTKEKFDEGKTEEYKKSGTYVGYTGSEYTFKNPKTGEWIGKVDFGDEAHQNVSNATRTLGNFMLSHSMYESFKDYMANAGNGGKYDIKSVGLDYKNTTQAERDKYGYQASFYNEYLIMTRRDQGNFFAGRTANMLGLSYETTMSGFGAYNDNGNQKGFLFYLKSGLNWLDQQLMGGAINGTPIQGINISPAFHDDKVSQDLQRAGYYQFQK